MSLKESNQMKSRSKHRLMVWGSRADPCREKRSSHRNLCKLLLGACPSRPQSSSLRNWKSNDGELRVAFWKKGEN